MPFADELSPDGVQVIEYQQSWPEQADDLIAQLRRLVPDAIAIEHIGSTAVPGMAAKPCIDLMIVVHDLETSTAESALIGHGYRRRPEPWNTQEPADGRLWRKLVFAPPVGGPSCNIHVRRSDAPTVRIARLFRDYLIADPKTLLIWSELKQAAAAVAPDLASYGRIKAPAWALLMQTAETWAQRSGYPTGSGADRPQ